MRLLFNYLPYSMKDSDSVVRSPKKANKKGPINGTCSNTKITKFFSSFYSSSGNNSNNNESTNNKNKNGTIKKRKTRTNGVNKSVERRGEERKIIANNIATQKTSRPMTNGTSKRRKSISSSQVSTASSASTSSSSGATITTVASTTNEKTSTSTQKVPKKIGRPRKGTNKSSPKLRPRRRASQTYFFKYQLARNPLKAEEEDLKLALLASLQQDDADLTKQHMQQLKRQQLIYEHHLQNSCNTANNNNSSSNNNNSTNNKQPRKAVQGNNQPNKQQKQKHPHAYETVVAQSLRPIPPVYDEDYLKRYRPDTEDFLTFICFRLNGQAQQYLPPIGQKNLANELVSTSISTANGSIDQLSSNNHSTSTSNGGSVSSSSSSTSTSGNNNNNINARPSNGYNPSTTTGINVKISNDNKSTLMNEYHNLRRSASPCKSSASNHTASNSSPNHLLNSPSNRRRPTRHSPRLASSSRKISEFDSLNHYTDYDNQIAYEEEMRRASDALDDMAQEIIGSGDDERTMTTTTPVGLLLKNDTSASVEGSANNNNNNNNITNNNTISSFGLKPSSSLSSPYKNNKHLVKGLMTREFAGAFADEEIIFESIKN